MVTAMLTAGMSSDRSAQSPSDYTGCRCFVSSTGFCGAVLGVEGSHAGSLYDFFASPYEDIRAVYALMDLMLEQGANNLAIYESSLLASFFEQFGFEAVAMLAGRNAPSSWIPDACRSASDPAAWPDFVFMARKIYETSPAVTSWMSRVGASPPASGRVDGREGPCANCAAPIASEHHPEFSGYRCARCGFIYICGTFTMGIPRPE